MNTSPVENKQFIAQYLKVLSGMPKTAEVLAQFVTDPNLLEHIRYVEAAFPAYELLADEIVAERDLVAMRGTFRGTHTGSFAGIEATGKTVSAALMIMYRISGGRIVEHWLHFDSSALLAQLGEPAAVSR